MTEIKQKLEPIRTWLDKEIWPEIHAMMSHDAYFRLMGKAAEIANSFKGPVGEIIINGYLAYQLMCIRRMCDKRNDVVSLPRILKAIGESGHHDKTVHLTSFLDKECKAVCSMSTQYIAHNADPVSPKGVVKWDLDAQGVARAQKAICQVAVTIERDLLKKTSRIALIPVPQFDYLQEFRTWIPPEKIETLRSFWQEHEKQVNNWLHIDYATLKAA